jgi:hypothetical protein
MKTDPRHLVQLSMIVEAGSFQTAADRLGITQPSLSRNIKLLESRIGARVFDRSTRRAAPTALGLKLAQHGLTIRIAEEQAAAYSALAALGAAGEPEIGATPIIADHFLSQRVASSCAITRMLTSNSEWASFTNSERCWSGGGLTWSWGREPCRTRAGDVVRVTVGRTHWHHLSRGPPIAGTQDDQRARA